MQAAKEPVSRVALSCRGILVASRTHTARTLMCEAVLKHLSGSRLPVVSGGFYHRENPHPLVMKCLQSHGIDTSSLVPHRSISSLMDSARTFDVFIGFGQCNSNPSVSSSLTDTYNSRNRENMPVEDLHTNKALFPSAPDHWEVSRAAVDRMPSWTVFSPLAPSIMHEDSTAKFQDHLYEGEPLFLEAIPTAIRRKVTLSEQWDIPGLTAGSQIGQHAMRFRPMERPSEERKRVEELYDAIFDRCHTLCLRLEEHYKEPILVVGK